ncbi:MAG: hypothetical protein VX549_11280 [Pseudomonadota bacterium]|nr:hypothetical protein [Pseudomonadota bacterium]
MTSWARAEAVLVGLQRDLRQLYDLPPGPDVHRFLMTDRGQASRYVSLAEGLQEALLIQQRGEDLDLSLYLDPQLLDELMSGRLHAGNLDAWLQALEGVSHFELVVQRAQSGHPVSELELELQAEIDKFVWLERQLHRQGRPAPRKLLLRWLFEQPRLRENLDAQQRWRYRTATQLARAYCEGLDGGAALRGGLNRLRRFYRLSGARKLRAAAAPAH